MSRSSTGTNSPWPSSRPAPGDKLTLRIVKAGQQAGQGVGYLEDGTMVVVEAAADFVDREADVVVTSVTQTAAGRMVFGRRS
ncbi:MAG: hypothetical protein QM775_18145 [Pirellulales bacterium]